MEKKVLDPEINLIKTDEFYLFYEMMMQSLKTDDVKAGINKSLAMLRTYLKSGNIALYKKNEDGVYIFKMSDSKMNDLIQPVSCIINKICPLIEQKEIFNLDLNLGILNNMMLLLIDTDNYEFDSDCIVAIINNDNNKLEPQFWNRIKDTLQVIFKRAASYERNTRAVTTDLLTGLENRNSYEMRMQTIDEEKQDLVFAVFDLFRLKYVNDNYTHAKGDEYIKKAAKILNKYWPKRKTLLNEDGTESFLETGHSVYRFGGDEFVLITSVENLQLANIKAGLAKDEVSMIDLGIQDELHLGINYGVVQHNIGESIKNTFICADDIMRKDKDEMYKEYKLDRRL